MTIRVYIRIYYVADIEVVDKVIRTGLGKVSPPDCEDLTHPLHHSHGLRGHNAVEIPTTSATGPQSLASCKQR